MKLGDRPDEPEIIMSTDRSLKWCASELKPKCLEWQTAIRCYFWIMSKPERNSDLECEWKDFCILVLAQLITVHAPGVLCTSFVRNFWKI